MDRRSVLSSGKRQGLIRVFKSDSATVPGLTLGVTATDEEAQTEGRREQADHLHSYISAVDGG